MPARCGDPRRRVCRDDARSGEPDHGSRPAAGNDVELAMAASQKPLRVLTVSAEELAAHEQVLAAIQKESGEMPLAERRAGRLTSLRRGIALPRGLDPDCLRHRIRRSAAATVDRCDAFRRHPAAGSRHLYRTGHRRPPDGPDGGGKAHIDGQQRESVLRVRANSATIRGLVLTCSGDSHDRVDSAIVVEGHYNRIEDNHIEDVLFGITLHASNHNVVARNFIRSPPGRSCRPR